MCRREEAGMESTGVRQTRWLQSQSRERGEERRERERERRATGQKAGRQARQASRRVGGSGGRLGAGARLAETGRWVPGRH